jgi:hypothetical protein
MPFEEFSSTYRARSSATLKSGMTAPATPASMASPGGARCGLGRIFRARLIPNPGSAARGDLPSADMVQRFITNKAAILAGRSPPGLLLTTVAVQSNALVRSTTAARSYVR